MSARETIQKMLSEWGRLSQAEGSAIASSAWLAMKEIQLAKASLQISLTDARQLWLEENPTTSPNEFPFRKEIGHLISLEARNAELLFAQQNRAQQDQKKLEGGRKNLRKIQRSYSGNCQGQNFHFSA
jgi:hypothetical protein